MRAYKDLLFSFHCENVFFKKGLAEIWDKVEAEAEAEAEHIFYGGKKNQKTVGVISNYFWIDVVTLTSKSIFEKLPKRDHLFEDENIGVIVFCTEKMKHIIKGITSYENAIFLDIDISVSEVEDLFKKIMTGSNESHREHFGKMSLESLTEKEKLVSELFSKGFTQQEIGRMTKMKSKTVSSHLRSAMAKYHVKSLLEYRVKLSHIK